MQLLPGLESVAVGMKSLLEWYSYAESIQPVVPRRAITREEVLLHCTVADCWCIIERRVYNLTPYLSFHPGGIKPLRPVFGKDATALFLQTHSWVNYEKLLEKMFVGYLA